MFYELSSEDMGALSSDPACCSSVFITPGHFPLVFFLGTGNTSRIRQYLQHNPVCGYSLRSVASCIEVSHTHDSYYFPHALCRGCFPLCLWSLACMTEMVDDKAERYTKYSTPIVTFPVDCFLKLSFSLNKHIFNWRTFTEIAFLQCLHIDLWVIALVAKMLKLAWRVTNKRGCYV